MKHVRQRALISTGSVAIVNDANKKFEYLSTAGGMGINLEITRMSENAERKKTYKDDAYSAFSFFMALYSQIFSSA